MTKLTQRQAAILALIESYLAEKGAPPTRVEIARDMGFRSPNAAEDHLRAMEKKGVLELMPGTSRGIRLTRNHSQLPCISDLSKLTYLDKKQLLTLPHQSPAAILGLDASPDQAYCLVSIPDDRFQAEGILPGDTLLVKLGSTVTLGSLCLLKQAGQLTLSRVETLPPSSSAKKKPTPAEPIIYGQVQQLIRSLNPNEVLA